MVLKKILLAFQPPGLGLVYAENNKDVTKHINLTKLNENTNTYELTNEILDQEILDIERYRNIIHIAITKIQQKLIENNRFKEQHSSLLHFLPITNIAIDNNGLNCVTGNYDRTARIWNLDSAKEVGCLEGHCNVVFSVAFNKNGDKILTGSFDKTAKIWDTNSAQLQQTFWGHKDEIVIAQFLPGDESIVTASTDTTLRLHQTETGQEIQICEGHTKDIVSVQIENEGKFIVSGSFDRTIRIWDARNGNCIHVLCGHEAEVSSCKIHEDGTNLVSGSFDGRTILWDLRQMKYYKIFTGPSAETRKVVDVDLKGTLVAASSADGFANVWDSASERSWQLQGHRGVVSRICFNPARDEVATCCDDRTVRVWSIGDSAATSHELMHKDAVFTCAYTRDGKKIVAACKDNTCKLWFRS